MAILKPEITDISNIINNATPASINIFIKCEVGTNNQIQYQIDNSSIWIDAQSFLSSVEDNALVVTGLQNATYISFRVISTNSPDSEISDEVSIFVDSLNTDKYGLSRAKILKGSLLKKIAKKITDVNKEFETVDGFDLIELIKEPINNEILIPQNPFTKEVDPKRSHSSNQNNRKKFTRFTGVLDIITQFDIKQNEGGTIQSGDIFIVINSLEMEKKRFTIDRLRNAFAINIREHHNIDKYGMALNVVNGAYKIKEIIPVTLSQRLLDLEVVVTPEALQLPK